MLTPEEQKLLERYTKEFGKNLGRVQNDIRLKEERFIRHQQQQKMAKGLSPKLKKSMKNPVKKQETTLVALDKQIQALEEELKL